MNKKLNILLVIIIASTLCFILGQSFMSVEASTKESNFVLDILHPVLEKFIPAESITNNTVRKMAHFIEFAFLGAGFAVFCAVNKYSVKKRAVLCALLGIYAALIDETVQLFTGRGAQIQDVWLDFSGFSSSAVVITVLFSIISKFKNI